MHPTNLDWTCTTVALNEMTILLFSENCFVYNSRLSYQISDFLAYTCILLHSTSIYAKKPKCEKMVYVPLLLSTAQIFVSESKLSLNMHQVNIF